MARSKYANKTKASKPPVVKPAWPSTGDSNSNNACFLKPSEFVLSKTLLLEILGYIPCRFTHKDYVAIARVVAQLEKQIEEDGNTTDSMTAESLEISKGSLDMDSRRSSQKSVQPEGRVKSQAKNKSKPVLVESPRIRKFGSHECMRRCIHLTSLTIKYSHIIRQLLEVCDFFSINPDLRDDSALVRVMLCDFMDRRLELRIPGKNEEVNERCLMIEEAIKHMHIRICADFARMRVKYRAPTMPDMLDEKIRDLERAVKKMPIYVWVNFLLVTKSEAIELMKDIGFTYCPSPSSRSPNRSKFHPDVHCPDLFLFNRYDADELNAQPAFKSQKLKFGDKLECLSLYVLIQKTNASSSVVLVNPNSITLAIHAESLFTMRHGKESIVGRKAIKMILTGSPMKTMDDEIIRIGEAGATSITIMEDVSNAGKWPTAEFVLVYGQSSMTGVIDPLEYLIFSERSDTAMLYSVLDYNHNHILDSQTQHYLRTSFESMKHSFEIMGIQSVLFLAHSIRSAETSQLVQKSIDLANHRAMSTTGLSWCTVRPVPDDFRTTEFITLSQENDGIFVSPSRECNGGFLAVIERQFSKTEPAANIKETPKKGTANNANINNKFRSSQSSVKRQNGTKRWNKKKILTDRSHQNEQFFAPTLAQKCNKVEFAHESNGDDLVLLDI